MVRRVTKAKWEIIKYTVAKATVEEAKEMIYWVRRAYDRVQYGKFVYVHVDKSPSDFPEGFNMRVLVSPWGRSTKKHHVNLQIRVIGMETCLGATRLVELLRLLDKLLAKEA